MVAAVFVALILALLAVAVRRITSAPLFSTLSICFANWADESRGRGSS